MTERAYIEVERNITFDPSSGCYDYDEPGIEFDNTYCVRCQAFVGPYLDEDDDTGRASEGWKTCFTGPLGIICEDCAEELEPS